MSGATMDREQKRVIADCGRMCERALTHADEADQRHNPEAAADWQTRAQFWSAEAFRWMAA